MGLDLGDKRIGVALTDPLGFTAQPFRVLGSRGMAQDIQAIGELISEYQVAQVVVGLPLNMDGTDSTRTGKVREIAGKLALRLSIPVMLADERLTTRQALQALREGGAGRKARKKNVDRVAAALILQSALDGITLVPVEVSGKGKS